MTCPEDRSFYDPMAVQCVECQLNTCVYQSVSSVEEANDRRERIRNAMRGMCAYVFSMGSDLKDAYNAQDHKTLGYDSFAAYCTGEFGVSKSTAYNMMAVSDEFGYLASTEPRYLEVEPTRLVQALPLVKERPEKEKREWLKCAHTLSPSDWKATINKAKGNPNQVDCEHPEETMRTIRVCGACGKREETS